METINYKDFSEKLSTVIETLNQHNEPLCLELPNSQRAIILSEQNYNSLTETLYLLNNPVKTDNIQKPHPDLAGQVQIKGDIFDSIPEHDWEILK